MAADENDEVLAIAREIERYLADHPHAADTLEGIQRWWLREQRHPPSQLARALERLEARGAVSRNSVAGKTIYSAAGADRAP
jgi:hypothetical protein